MWNFMSLVGKTLIKFKKILFLLNKKTYFGFVNGHSYLTKYETAILYDLLAGNEKSNGRVTKQFENEFSKLIGNGKAVSFAAGRMAFYSLMKILEIGTGDEVILQASNCAVMVNAVLRIGAKPVFADIDINTMGTDPNSVHKLITSKTKLIVAQHSFGIPCEIDKLVEIANQHDVFILEDCALCVGSRYKGVKLGNWGDAALFSIDHSKPINCMIGGLLYVKNEQLYQKIYEYKNKLPYLNKKHQAALFKQLLFEKEYFNPNKYSLAKLIELYKRILNKIIKSQIIFLTDEYNHPDSQQTANYPYPAKLPVFISQLGLYELQHFKTSMGKRTQLLNEYINVFVENDQIQLLPKAYFDKRNEIIPLRLIAHLPNRYEAEKYFNKIFEINSTWFLKPIIACEDPEKLEYIYGSCSNSELSSESIINFPCTFDPKYRKKILVPLNSFLSKRINLQLN
ncbi:MAG: hypothetical protein A2W90_16620 [Bacteroidetes bacterium GWF2_42_66]|nr:MAG: hypothetical protein A2W89_05550 [Bacteroidetes bacterium GWE2_42_39]OFY46357.1 MAG: hypothetical protein A2W90_16620 [Bacteroidetes bacterium GWF2_42_66]